MGVGEQVGILIDSRGRHIVLESCLVPSVNSALPPVGTWMGTPELPKKVWWWLIACLSVRANQT